MKRVLNYSELFLFEDPFASRWLRVETTSESDQWLTIDIAYKIAYGELIPENILSFKGYMGGPPADIIYGGIIFRCITDKVLNILKDNQFTGWSTYPVEVSDRKGNILPGYQGFSITSYAGKRDLTRSPKIITHKAPDGRTSEAYKGYYFDESKWDGSDIFRVQAFDIVVTKAVKEAFQRNKIHNVKFIALSDEETSVSVYSK